MSEWKEFILKNLLIEKGYIRGPFGSSLKRSEMKKEGTPVYEQEHAIYNNRIFRFFIDKEKTAELKRFLVKDNDLIISCSGTVGKVSIIKEDDPKGIISQALLLLRPNTEIIFPEYLHYFFKSKNGFNQLINASEGSVQPNISSRGIVESIPINIPPKEIQNKILTVLFSLDDKIDLLNRQNKTLEALAETLFRQWFNEEADENWERGRLGDIASFFNGKSRPNEIKNGSIPIYGGNGILGSTDRSNYSGMSIIIGRVGAYCGSLYLENKEIWVSDNALLSRPKNSNYIYFLFYLLKSLDLNSMAEGSSHPLLTQTLLNSIDIIIPPLEKVNSFDFQVKALWNKIYHNLTQIRTLTQLRDTLLPKLMCGEVRVEG